MKSTSDPSGSGPPMAGRGSRLDPIVVFCGIFACLVGLTVLVGWATGSLLLQSFFTGSITIKSNTAVCLGLLGGSLLLLMRPRGRRHALRLALGRGCAALAAGIGLATLSEHLFGWDLGIDQLLFREAPGALLTVSPNRFGVPSSICIPLLGASLVLMGRRGRRGNAPFQGLALSAILLSLVSLLGYLYSVRELYGVAWLTTVAVHTALAYLLLGLGILLARPRTGFMRRITARDAGGLLIRRMLPAAIGLPLVLGWLRAAAEDAHLFGGDLGRVLLLLAFIVLFSALVWWAGGLATRAVAGPGDEAAPDREAEGRAPGFTPTALVRRQLQDAAFAGFVLTIAVLVAGAGLAALNVHRLLENDRRAERSREVDTQLEALFSAVTDAETGQRGYLLTQDEHYLAPYDSALTRLSAAVARLERLTASDPEQRVRLDGLLPTLNVRLGELERTIGLARSGQRAAALAIVDSHLGKVTMDRLRASVDAMHASQLDLLRRRSAESEASAQAALFWVLLSSAIGVILVGLVFYLSQRALLLRQQAAEVVARQREQLRVTLSSIADAVITTDTAGRVTSLNPVAEALSGCRQSDAVGRPLDEVFRLVDEATWRPLESPAARAVRDGGVAPLVDHAVLRTRDGTVWPIDASAAPIRTAGGAVLGAVLVFRDITERRRASAALAESEERFRVMADGSPILIWVTDPAGTVQFVNQACQAYFGDPLEKSTHDQWRPLLHPDDAERFTRAFLGALERHEAWTGEARVRRADGEWRWLLVQSNPRFSAGGEFLGAVGSGSDVTDSRRARERVELLAAAGAILDDVGDLAAVMRRIAQLAVPRFADWALVDRLKDGRVEMVAAVHSDPRQQPLLDELPAGFALADEPDLLVARALRSGQPVLEPALAPDALRRAVRREGHRRALEALAPRSCIVVPLTERGVPSGALAFVRHAGSPAFNAQDLALAQEVARRLSLAADNARLLAEIQAADQRKNEFLAVLAHELRNPLAPVRNVAHLLKLRVADAELARPIDMIDRQVAHMARLIDDLLDVSRIARGALELKREPVDVREVVQAALEACRDEIAARAHVLAVDLPPRPLPLEADRHRLLQVLCNLLLNAARYTPPGGRIDLAARQDSEGIEIAVADNGQGIPRDKLGEIFELFAQVDRSLERQGGLGIGLTLARQVVELHGGTLEARSEGPGRGSTFVLRLPRALPPADAAPEEVPTVPGQRPRAEPRRILVADDNQDAAESLAALLRLDGHRVEVALDGEAALARAEEAPPEVAVLDIGMPRLNGYEVARRLRATERGRAMFLIALTGWGQETDRAQADAAGFDAHVVKPADPQEISRILSLLARSQALAP